MPVSLELTAVVEGDDNVSLFPAPLAKFHRCDVGPELPCRSEDFVHLRGWDGQVVASYPEEQRYHFISELD